MAVILNILKKWGFTILKNIPNFNFLKKIKIFDFLKEKAKGSL